MVTLGGIQKSEHKTSKTSRTNILFWHMSTSTEGGHTRSRHSLTDSMEQLPSGKANNSIEVDVHRRTQNSPSLLPWDKWIQRTISHRTAERRSFVFRGLRLQIPARRPPPSWQGAFTISLQANASWYIKLGYDSFLPYPFHYSLYNLTANKDTHWIFYFPGRIWQEMKERFGPPQSTHHKFPSPIRIRSQQHTSRNAPLRLSAVSAKFLSRETQANFHSGNTFHNITFSALHAYCKPNLTKFKYQGTAQ